MIQFLKYEITLVRIERLAIMLLRGARRRQLIGVGHPQGRVIDILLKETDTHWTLTLIGTCAEVEDDEAFVKKAAAQTKTTETQTDGSKKETAENS